MSTLDKRNIVMHTHRKVNVSILDISIRKCFINGPDLITVGGAGDGGTLIHTFIYKKKSKINANFGIMHEGGTTCRKLVKTEAGFIWLNSNCLVHSLFYKNPEGSISFALMCMYHTKARYGNHSKR